MVVNAYSDYAAYGFLQNVLDKLLLKNWEDSTARESPRRQLLG